MRQFDRIRAHKPEGIENKKAHIVGGGIAGLANAVFLIDDGYMDGKNVTIYEQLSDVGGSMDGAKNKEQARLYQPRRKRTRTEHGMFVVSLLENPFADRTRSYRFGRNGGN